MSVLSIDLESRRARKSARHPHFRLSAHQQPRIWRSGAPGRGDVPHLRSQPGAPDHLFALRPKSHWLNLLAKDRDSTAHRPQALAVRFYHQCSASPVFCGGKKSMSCMPFFSMPNYGATRGSSGGSSGCHRLGTKRGLRPASPARRFVAPDPALVHRHGGQFFCRKELHHAHPETGRIPARSRP